MERIDAVVIGAGVIGLAVARELAVAGREVIIVEAEKMIGSVTSARNSEVIHAGIYYPAGSLKASMCVAGRHMLYEYCERHHVPHRRCGKLLVATSTEQIDKLESIRAHAEANEVGGLEPISEARAVAMEPALQCSAALHSPSTGIIDSHTYMHSLLGEARDHGAMLALASRLQRGAVSRDGIHLTIQSEGSESTTLCACMVVNAAGLSAPAVAGRIDGLDSRHVPRPYFAKGNYYSLSGRAPFSRLIYPVPVAGGLGVHLTLDLGGQARFGPDVEWLDIEREEDIRYEVDPRRADRFYAEIRKYWPGIADGALLPAYSGVRPKLAAQGTPDADFVIQGPAEHGIPGLVNLFGIESPGLTSSLAIAREVAVRLAGSTTVEVA